MKRSRGVYFLYSGTEDNTREHSYLSVLNSQAGSLLIKHEVTLLRGQICECCYYETVRLILRSWVYQVTYREPNSSAVKQGVIKRFRKVTDDGHNQNGTILQIAAQSLV